ncbi:MAG: hypothetical protein GY801_29825 [bacterium]|nr:hypothetical protein [bacterium]
MKIATFLRRHLFELPQFPVLKSIGHGNRKGIVQQFDELDMFLGAAIRLILSERSLERLVPP